MSKKAKVVVIDNDEKTRHSLERVISSSGHDVRTYDSGLCYLDDVVRDGRPDCVIVDVHMPEITGLELYGILKTQDPKLPVIFITGTPDQTLDEKARALESQRFFTKPLVTDAILSCIDGAIASAAHHSGGSARRQLFR